MIVGAVEQLGLAILDPLGASKRLALWAMAIAAAVETISLMATLIALLKMAS
jgi:hypothetical protein